MALPLGCPLSHVAAQHITTSDATRRVRATLNRFSLMPILRSHPLRLAYLVCLVALPATLRSQSSATLSSIERSVTRAVDSHNAEALSLLERLVNINSGTLNLAGVRQVGDVLRAQFDTLGFKTRW